MGRRQRVINPLFTNNQQMSNQWIKLENKFNLPTGKLIAGNFNPESSFYNTWMEGELYLYKNEEMLEQYLEAVELGGLDKKKLLAIGKMICEKGRE